MVHFSRPVGKTVFVRLAVVVDWVVVVTVVTVVVVAVDVVAVVVVVVVQGSYKK